MVQVLSDEIITGGATAVNIGQGGQVPGVVVTELVGELVVVTASQLHLVNTVIEEVCT